MLYVFVRIVEEFFYSSLKSERKKVVLTKSAGCFELRCDPFHVVENGLKHRRRIPNDRQVIDWLIHRKELLNVWAVSKMMRNDVWFRATLAISVNIRHFE